MKGYIINDRRVGHNKKGFKVAPKIVDKQVKKTEILHAAMQVFSQKGVVKTKMIDVAKAAGIGKGTIYEYFRSKEEIFAEAFNLMFFHIETQLADLISGTDNPTEKLHKLIEVSLKEFLEHSGDMASIMMDFWAEGIRNKDTDVINLINLEQIYSEFRLIIADILSDGINKGVFRNIDVQSMAAIIIAVIDGVLLQWTINKNIIDINKISEVMFDTLINGIRL